MKLDELREDYTSSSEILHELMEILNKSSIESVLEFTDGDLTAFSKLERECKRLEEVRKIYSKSIQMKASVHCLTETDVLTGHARRTEVKTLSEYMNDIQPALVTPAIPCPS